MIEGHVKETLLFILALEVPFVLIKSNNNIKGLDIYGYNFLYAAFADDSSFLFKNKNSVTEAFKILDWFSFSSGLKPNKEKFEVAGIGVKKGVKIALCGMKNIDLKKQRKFLELIILTTKNLKMKKNSKIIYRK